MIAQLMDSNWFPLIYLLILAIMVISGVVLSRRSHLPELHKDWKTKSLVGAIISFFSLLLAFTLSSSSNSSKARVNFIHQHKGALASLYRQSLLFDDSMHHSVKAYVLKAIAIKLAAADSSNSAEAIKKLYKNSTILNNTYLRSITQLAKDSAHPHTGVNAIADQMSKIIDLDDQVHYSNEERTPAVVMMLLIIGSWIIGFLMGIAGTFFQERYYFGPIIFTALTSLTVLIIQDMDNPHQGFVKPPYEIYRELENEIRSE